MGLEQDRGMARIFQLMLNAVGLHLNNCCGVKRENITNEPRKAFCQWWVNHVKWNETFRISAHWHRTRALEMVLFIKRLNNEPPFSVQVEVKET